MRFARPGRCGRLYPALGLRARIGVNTGEVVAGSGDSLVTGDAVNVAARLEQAAEAGEVIVGAETQRLVRDAVTVQPVGYIVAKGKPDPVAAFRLVEVDPGAAAIARRFDRPLIGRGRDSPCSATRSPVPSKSGRATCSRCSARPASASRGSSPSSSPERMRPSSVDGAWTTARESPTGR